MKKFWKKAEVKEIFTNTFQVLLDNKILKTPMKKDLSFLNYQIASETSKEWNIEGTIINTDRMIFYGLVSTAIDKISKNRNLFINQILTFIDTDLICYRADAPNDRVVVVAGDPPYSIAGLFACSRACRVPNHPIIRQQEDGQTDGHTYRGTGGRTNRQTDGRTADGRCWSRQHVSKCEVEVK